MTTPDIKIGDRVRSTRTDSDMYGWEGRIVEGSDNTQEFLQDGEFIVAYEQNRYLSDTEWYERYDEEGTNWEVVHLEVTL